MKSLQFTLPWAFLALLAASLSNLPRASQPNATVSNNNGSSNASVSIHETAEKPDVCNDLDDAVRFELNKDYFEKDCPAVNQFLPNGDCDWTNAPQKDDTTCAFFCQVQTTFLPTQEIPIADSYCRGPRLCSISDRIILNVNNEWSGTPTEAQALEEGVSAGFDNTTGMKTVVAGPGQITLGQGECGYFTWIGTKRSVCGSLTEATRHEHDPEYPGGPPTCLEPAATRSYCTETLYGGRGDDPTKFGKTVFVRVDCATRAPLPAEMQDPLFGFDGVALAPDRLEVVLQSWVRATCRLKDHALWDSYEIHGRGFRDDKLGAYGRGLLSKLRSCCAGTVTAWKFYYTPDDNDYDWKATGNVGPFGTQCPGVALMGIGANDQDSC
ncbi:hypothetical protein F4777DRAFT_582500 [Nemania sp. FL0916]|nr:hypothetical protein F4777DRAFT_582500 [Nemania sp. FL0916]